jgi:hypothetical protein
MKLILIDFQNDFKVKDLRVSPQHSSKDEVLPSSGRRIPQIR